MFTITDISQLRIWGKKFHGMGSLSSDLPPTLVIAPRFLLCVLQVYAFFYVDISPWSLGAYWVRCILRAVAWSLSCPLLCAFVLPNTDHRTWLPQPLGRHGRLCSTLSWTSCLHPWAPTLYLTELSLWTLCAWGRTCDSYTAPWRFATLIRSNWSNQSQSQLMPGRLYL